jgi:hypothetical protein
MQENLQAYKKEAAVVIQVLKQGGRWKPGKADSHLEKRKTLGHLPPEMSVEEYNGLVQFVVQNVENQVYLYFFCSERSYALRGEAGQAEWLVIASAEGVIETAFPPDAMDDYLVKRGFVLLGTIREVGA